MSATVVFLHAHPDDEAILTGGTIARLAAEGHRVVLVTATDGAAGLTATPSANDQTLAAIRAEELDRSARALGAARVVRLGYGDSGLDGHGTSSTTGRLASDRELFVEAAMTGLAERVGDVLAQENADVVVGYDAAGGYGHPDHVRVHEVTRAAFDLTDTKLLLEATLPREPIAKVLRAVNLCRPFVSAWAELDIAAWRHSYTPRSELAVAVDVRDYLAAKRAAFAAHGSQTLADGGVRTMRLALRLPKPIFASLFGTEWFGAPYLPAQSRFPHPLSALGFGTLGNAVGFSTGSRWVKEP